MEELVAGLLGVVVGGTLGQGGKSVVKFVAKRCMDVSDYTHRVTSGLRQDFQASVEEARHERDEP